MDLTSPVAQKYHIELGITNCKIVQIGKGPKAEVMIGQEQMEETTAYKYLGKMINNKANLKHHITEVKNKADGAVQIILAETGNKEFKGMNMNC